MVKNIWGVFDQVRVEDAKILSTGGTIELDGKIVVRDVSRVLPGYTRYLDEIISDKRRFIKPELIEVICSAQYTMSEHLLYEALNYISDNYNNKTVKAFVTETLLHAFDYITNDKSGKDAMRDLSTLLARLRALYMASRSSDPALLKMRDLGGEILKKSISSRSESTIASVRTGVCLFIILRVFTKNYYS
jgi:hypothetical protein